MHPILIKQGTLGFSLGLTNIFGTELTRYSLSSFLVEGGFFIPSNKLSLGIKPILNNNRKLNDEKVRMYGLHICIDNNEVMCYTVNTGGSKSNRDLYPVQECVEVFDMETIDVLMSSSYNEPVKQVSNAALRLVSSNELALMLIEEVIAIDTNHYVWYTKSELVKQYKKLKGL